MRSTKTKSNTTCLPSFEFKESTHIIPNSMGGSHVWTDGTDTYYSYGTIHYVLDKSNNEWVSKTWSGLTSFDGLYIWTDSASVYYTYNSANYVLDKSTSTWSSKTWNNFTPSAANYIWTDGTNIYYSSGSNHYVLNRVTSTWNATGWSSYFNGYEVWTDGTKICRLVSDSSSINVYTYTFDKATSEWSRDDSIPSVSRNYSWTDGKSLFTRSNNNIYYRRLGSRLVKIGIYTGYMESSLINGYGDYYWTDGESIFYSEGSSQLQFISQ